MSDAAVFSEPSRGLIPDELLRTCISCGFCLAACPTYQDTRREASSPRGRINLMRALEGGALDSEDVREELSFCLGCRACETVCPAGVRYGSLLEHARDAIGPAPDPRLRALLWAVRTRRRTRLAGIGIVVGLVLTVLLLQVHYILAFVVGFGLMLVSAVQLEGGIRHLGRVGVQQVADSIRQSGMKDLFGRRSVDDADDEFH